jgi:hypothetical protein
MITSGVRQPVASRRWSIPIEAMENLLKAPAARLRITERAISR